MAWSGLSCVASITVVAAAVGLTACAQDGTVGPEGPRGDNGAMGEQGVAKALQIIHRELDLTMAFCGHTDIRTVDKGILLPGSY